MVNYDASIIKGYAGALYRWAQVALVVHTVGWAMLGAAPLLLGETRFVVFTIPALASIGYMVGSLKAASLRLEAQVALCQVQIEANTRASAAAGASPSGSKVAAAGAAIRAQTSVASPSPGSQESALNSNKVGARRVSPPPEAGVVAAAGSADFRCNGCGTTFLGPATRVCPSCGSSVKVPLR